MPGSDHSEGSQLTPNITDSSVSNPPRLLVGEARASAALPIRSLARAILRKGSVNAGRVGQDAAAVHENNRRLALLCGGAWCQKCTFTVTEISVENPPAHPSRHSPPTK